MAISASTVWEVRTTGNDNNGGGFVAGASGTDFSQQNAAQYSFADLASTSGTTNPSIVTSASHSFVAADVGNLIHVTAGTNWTAGFYQIVSVATGAATLDRAVGAVASLTAGSYSVGGAIATIPTLASNMAANNTAWVKGGTYSLSSAPAAFNSANLYGYTTTRGDGGKATIQASSGTTSYCSTSPSTSNVFRNIVFDAGLVADYGLLEHGNSALINCDFKNANSYCYRNADGASNLFFCTATGLKAGGTGGFRQDNGGVLFGCVSYSNAGYGFTGGSRAYSVCCAAYANNNHGFDLSNLGSGANTMGAFMCVSWDNGADGFACGASNVVFVFNCISYLNAGWGISASSSIPSQYGDYNAYGSNTSGNLTNFTAGAHDQPLSANPFTNAPTDFSLNNAAGGGAACRVAGFPGAMPLGGTGAIDIGLLQHVCAIIAGMIFVAECQPIAFLRQFFPVL